MSDYFLGVDGGQSGTMAVIGDAQGQVVGWASAGPCNHVAADQARAKFRRVMSGCIGQAAAMVGLDPTRPKFRAACMGMSGGPDDKASILRELVGADQMVVTHDAKIAWAGALEGQPGVAVIAGTGSIAYGENAAGVPTRAGGWGYIFGDEGGAFDIGRQALRAILRQHEGWGPMTALTPALLELTHAGDADIAMHRLYTPDWPRSRVAELAVTVNRIAEEGDPIALEILHGAALQLAMLAAAVRRQLWAQGEESGLIPIAGIGGVFGSNVVLERFRLLVGLEGGAIWHTPRHSPALGALVIAYKAAAVPVLLKPNSELVRGK